ncbi:MAG TPA: hypothetical protein VFS34_12130 [Thermoanaerobaculia bacterium]|nr:hypothetical protein [Thermoanaerobaculia bacterium]
MSESGNDTAAPEASSTPVLEDDRRQKAAEINRKRTEAEWLRNKERWIEENFPEKRKTPAD